MAGEPPKDVASSSEDWRTCARDLVRMTFYGAIDGGGYTSSNERGFSGENASLYVLTTSPDGRESLLQIGYGEFSRLTFEGDRYPAFHQARYDIFVVSQGRSYFANP